MNSPFHFYTDEDADVSGVQIAPLEAALGASIDSDVPTAVEIVFVGKEDIRRLNREQRQVDRVTDVLSFPSLDGIRGKALRGKDFPRDIDEEGNLFLGSVVICRARAREQAAEYGHSYERELHYLLVHGVLHCLGYDHVTDEDRAQMRAREESVLGKIGLSREGDEPSASGK